PAGNFSLLSFLLVFQKKADLIETKIFIFLLTLFWTDVEMAIIRSEDNFTCGTFKYTLSCHKKSYSNVPQVYPHKYF
ncbi:MAG: hypothetical protein ABI528_06565, partial [bacterium]